jgi:acetyl-CoA carboxylase carboxyl transferase subunit beta
MSDQPATTTAKRGRIPEGLWLACPSCAAMLYRKQLEQNLSVCPDCKYHFRISARARIAQIADEATFEEFDRDIESTDPLGFEDRKPYKDRLAAEQLKSGSTEALVSGRAFIKGRPIILAAMDPMFLMGSMGSVVGEKLTRAIERATDEKLPLIVVSCSGGARMQESASRCWGISSWRSRGP